MNLVLEANSSQAVTALNANNPTTVRVQNVLRRERRRILRNGYSFNTDIVTLTVDTGRVPIPQTYLKVLLPKGYSYRTDGGVHYVWDIQARDYHDAALNDVTVVFDIEDFEDIAGPFGEWIAREAALKFHEGKNQSTSGHLREDAAREAAHAINSEPPSNLLSTAAPGLVGGSGSPHRSYGYYWIALP